MPLVRASCVGKQHCALRVSSCGAWVFNTAGIATFFPGLSRTEFRAHEKSRIWLTEPGDCGFQGSVEMVSRTPDGEIIKSI